MRGHRQERAWYAQVGVAMPDVKRGEQAAKEAA